MTLYMKVTRDKYELPVAVADTKAELARIVGVSLSAISHSLHGPGTRKAYVEVEVEDEDQT